jgi:hypothetical protein
MQIVTGLVSHQRRNGCWLWQGARVLGGHGLARRYQAHPSDTTQTIVTVFVALAVENNVLAKKKEFVKVPVLRNLVPAQVLSGKSSFNSGSSISAGPAVYARNEVKAMAALLERTFTILIFG